MSLEDITLSEKGQLQKTTYDLTAFIENVQNETSADRERWLLRMAKGRGTKGGHSENRQAFFLR